MLFGANFALSGYKIEMALPDVPAGTEVNLAQYVSYFYTFGLSLVAILAVGGLVIGGFLYMFSDTISSTEEAKKYIWSALSSLVLLLSAYLILYTINPNLVSLRAPTLQKLAPVAPPENWQGKCTCYLQGEMVCMGNTEKECQKDCLTKCKENCLTYWKVIELCSKK